MLASQKERREGGTSVEYDLILARSVTYAQRMQRALGRAGIACRIYRAPRELSAQGCAYAVQIRAGDLAQALTVIHRESLDPVSVYLNQSGLYREVR